MSDEEEEEVVQCVRVGMKRVMVGVSIRVSVTAKFRARDFGA